VKSKHIQTSKFLSFILRHKPGAISLELDHAGWARIEDLIKCAADHGRLLDEPLIRRVVETNDKRRFCISRDGKKIRANQGHSIGIDLGLTPKQPPRFLFHGTAEKHLASILKSGLHPAKRQHVHLSPDVKTAVKVGRRHGKPVVLEIAAGFMYTDGRVFYISENGVWLTGPIEPNFIAVWRHGVKKE
jgi:putative RNA 2'-phosphotransferase